MSEGLPPAPRQGAVVRSPAPPEPEAEPLIIDAEFRALSPARGLWRRLRGRWWALGPYLAYCAATWGLAALIGWLVSKGRP